MSKFSDLLTVIGLAPKTLPQANETLATAKATLDSVAALFTAAGLNLETMLAAGPDALKAHLESIDNTEELAESLQEVERLQGELLNANTLAEETTASLLAHNEVFATLGLSASDLKPDAFKTAFESHVAKQTTLALAKTGHPPAHVPAVSASSADAAPTDSEIAAEYQAMKPGPDRLAFYSKHEVALNRFAKSLRKPE